MRVPILSTRRPATSRPIAYAAWNAVDNVTVVEFGKADGVLERGLEQRDDLTVHIIDGGRKEQHGADSPAHMSKSCAAAVLLHGFGRDGIIHACPF